MAKSTPKVEAEPIYNPDRRFFVPDFSPEERRELALMKPSVIFVAESPHINEIESEILEQRRPLCGVAGRQWWSLLSEMLEGKADQNVDLQHILNFCKKHRIAVMNAVQYPLDPNVGKTFPNANPEKNLGFSKLIGIYSFRKLKNTRPVQETLDSLAKRLRHSSLDNVPIHCLGNDADWFVKRALSTSEVSSRLGEKIPHPSAWWRRGGMFGMMAREKLSKIFP